LGCAQAKPNQPHQHPRDVGLSPDGEAIAKANAPLPPTFFNPTYAKRFVRQSESDQRQSRSIEDFV
jgi:hypothetical protein